VIMEAPLSLHGRCVPWHIGTGNRRQICDFEVQPPPHDQMPRWIQEKTPMFQSTRSAPAPRSLQACANHEKRQNEVYVLQHQPIPQQPPKQQQLQHHQLPGLAQQLRLQELFGDEMLLSEFQRMDGMERRFYVPPQLRTTRNAQIHPQAKIGVAKDGRIPISDRRECRSMCMPEGMGVIDPNCQGEDYRVNSGYQPSRLGDAVDRCFDPCYKWKPFRDGTSAGHKANHWQFGKGPTGRGTGSSKASNCKTNECPENETTIGNRSVIPKLGGMIPGYGGHVPGFERCKFGKTYGRETADVLRKVKSTAKIPNSYSMAEWRTKCYNKEVNC